MPVTLLKSKVHHAQLLIQACYRTLIKNISGTILTKGNSHTLAAETTVKLRETHGSYQLQDRRVFTFRKFTLKIVSTFYVELV